MSWAEFMLRSFAFNRIQKREMMLTREVAYEVHKTQYLFGKKKPPTKDEFWDINGRKANKMDKIAEALARASKKENG